MAIHPPIPLHNIWLLFLYAAELLRFKDSTQVEAQTATDLPELMARLLTQAVQQRLRRTLNRGYYTQQAVLPRVRGRIDVLATLSGRLLEQGRVACRFEAHTLDTHRNRLVRAALDYLAIRVAAPAVAHACKALSKRMGELGVANAKPSRAAMAADQINRNETDDWLMVSLAKMVFEVLIPSEQEGKIHAVAPDATVHLLRRLFEKAVGNALRIQLQPHGWGIQQGRKLKWPLEQASAGMQAHLPGMQTDIELVHYANKRLVVIDTKFTHIFTASHYKEDMLRNAYLYQMYAYLRTQEADTVAKGWQSEGMLLHPQCGPALDVHMDLQGHRMRFKTIDVTASAQAFEQQLACLGDFLSVPPL